MIGGILESFPFVCLFAHLSMCRRAISEINFDYFCFFLVFSVIKTFHIRCKPHTLDWIHAFILLFIAQQYGSIIWVVNWVAAQSSFFLIEKILEMKSQPPRNCPIFPDILAEWAAVNNPIWQTTFLLKYNLACWLDV